MKKLVSVLFAFAIVFGGAFSGLYGASDTTPPVLTTLTAPTSVSGVGSGPVSATFTASATDDLSGVQYIQVAICLQIAGSNCGSGAGWSAGAVNVYVTPPNVNSGTLTLVLPIPRYARVGTYNIMVLVVDAVGNTTQYTASQLGAMSLPDTLTVAN
jgi:hypothetical protein